MPAASQSVSPSASEISGRRERLDWPSLPFATFCCCLRKQNNAQKGGCSPRFRTIRERRINCCGGRNKRYESGPLFIVRGINKRRKRDEIAPHSRVPHRHGCGPHARAAWGGGCLVPAEPALTFARRNDCVTCRGEKFRVPIRARRGNPVCCVCLSVCLSPTRVGAPGTYGTRDVGRAT